MWNSVDSLSRLIFGLQWTSTVIVALLGASIIFLTIRKNDLQRVAERLKEEQISLAKKAAGEANAAAQEAILKQKMIEQESIKLALQLEQEHEARLKLEQGVSVTQSQVTQVKKSQEPRKLSGHQNSVFLQSLLKGAGNTVRVTSLGDKEASAFASEIIGVFVKAGWQVEQTRIGLYSPPTYGVVLDMSDQQAGTDAGKILLLALRSANIQFSTRPNADRLINLFVAMKP
jgi:hypothetical protein